MSFKKKSNHIHTFTIDHYSAVDDMRYQGNFSAKKLSIRDLSALGVRRAQLNGGLHFDPENPGRGVDETTEQLNNMMAHLEIALVTTPPWWNLDEVTDTDLIATVFQEVMSFENSFLERKARHVDGGSGAAGSETTEESSNAGGNPTEVVDRQVQASLEP